MKRSAIMPYALAAVSLVVFPGCEALVGLVTTSTVTVTLQNDSDQFPVAATIFYDDEEDTLKLLVIEFGESQDFSVPAGESRSMTRSCDDLRGLVLEDADLLIVSGLGPETDSDLLRIGSDFECGDEVVFTFSHEIIPLNLRLNITTR